MEAYITSTHMCPRRTRRTQFQLHVCQRMSHERRLMQRTKVYAGTCSVADAEVKRAKRHVTGPDGLFTRADVEIRTWLIRSLAVYTRQNPQAAAGCGLCVTSRTGWVYGSPRSSPRTVRHRNGPRRRVIRDQQVSGAAALGTNRAT